VLLRLKLARCRCANPECARQTFGDRLPAVAQPYARRTCRVVDLARLMTHTAGGRPAGRLIARLGMPQSKDALLRSLKRGVRDRTGPAPVRVGGVDDWSWQKGRTYGTIMVDLERREVLDIPQDRLDLAQHVFPSPARTRLRSLPPRGLRAAPPSEKRFTLR
jgi:hypothetical protein